MRVWRNPGLRQADRLPVSSYEEAVRMLVCFNVDETIPDEAFDLAVEVVADIFWRNDRAVRRDVIVETKRLGV